MAEEKQTNYTIAEEYEIPSKGIIYSAKVNPRIELRSMTARDEMKRLNPSSTQFKLLADIIEGCCIEKPAIHVYDMALGDYEYLLHRLRVITYGEEYKISLRCPYCGEVIDTVAHLDELRVKEFDKDKFESYRSFMLPKLGKLVTLNVQTPRTLDEIELRSKELKRKFPDAEISFETFVTLKLAIDTVDGAKLNDSQLESFINKLPAADMVKILNNLDEMNDCIGLDNRLIVDCPKCGGEVRTSFRFGQEFFRPTNI